MNRARKIILESFVLLAVAAVFNTAPANANHVLSAAERSVMYCEAAEVNLPDTVRITASVMRSSRDDVTKLEAAFADWRKQSKPYLYKHFARCHDSQARNRLNGMLNFDFAQITHALGSDAWKTTTNQALQQLTRCTSDYLGQSKGAKCQTQIDELSKNKVTWGMVESAYQRYHRDEPPPHTSTPNVGPTPYDPMISMPMPKT